MLLIDEVDRADDEFEAFLFEMLAEASVTHPRARHLRALAPPIVVLTSNRTRDLHDALRRRCLYHWIDYPSADSRGRDHPPTGPGGIDVLARQVAEAVAAAAHAAADESHRASPRRSTGRPRCARSASPALDAVSAEATLGAVLKHDEDHDARTRIGLPALVGVRVTGDLDPTCRRPVRGRAARRRAAGRTRPGRTVRRAITIAAPTTLPGLRCVRARHSRR